jgi:hypothetical protein
LILFDDRSRLKDLPTGLWSTSLNETEVGARVILRREAGGRTELRREPRLRGPKPGFVVSECAPEAPALSFVPQDTDNYPACNWMRGLLRRECIVYQPNLNELRKAQPSPGATFRVAPDASTLAWSVLAFAKEDERGYKEWNQHLQSVLPNFDYADAKQREDDKFAYSRVHYRNGLIVPGHGLSDGTLSLLALTVLPYLPNIPRILAIEEPENGIHPKAIEAVLEMLQAIEGGDVWVTSHSPIVVAVTPLKHLLCLSVDKNGSVIAVPGTKHPLLVAWQGTPDLGTLHSAGVL